LNDEHPAAQAELQAATNGRGSWPHSVQLRLNPSSPCIAVKRAAPAVSTQVVLQSARVWDGVHAPPAALRPMSSSIRVMPSPHLKSASGFANSFRAGTPVINGAIAASPVAAAALPVGGHPARVNIAPAVHASPVVAAQSTGAPPSEDIGPWYAAACEFEMNTDFDVDAALNSATLFVGNGGFHGLPELMTVMKNGSGGKRTIQALGDKILLSQMLQNLQIPQMPVLFSTYSTVNHAEVEALVHRLNSTTDGDAFDIVVKPTHLSNGSGALILSKDKWQNEGYNAAKLTEHMSKFLAMKADDSESEALKSLVPGFVVQPRYRSSVDFGLPLEMRVITLWGKARIGIWWWGREKGDSKGQRTTWLVRKIRYPGRLSRDDSWEILHEHSGENKGYNVALKMFVEAMPMMATAAESIATAVGAPFLRSDFFIGSPKWGVRLNEVAYGSGIDYRNRPTGSVGFVDDGPVIAKILQHGFSVCKRNPPEYFLSRVGAQGASYEEPDWKFWASRTKPAIQVSALTEKSRLRLPSDAVETMINCREVPEVKAPDCRTTKHKDTNGFVGFGLDLPQAQPQAQPNQAGGQGPVRFSTPSPYPARRAAYSVRVPSGGMGAQAVRAASVGALQPVRQQYAIPQIPIRVVSAQPAPMNGLLVQ